jgi:hypothetical protein
MGALEAVKDTEGNQGMGKVLAENKLLRKDLKNLVGYVTPYIPLIGILSGAITVRKHVVSTNVTVNKLTFLMYIFNSLSTGPSRVVRERLTRLIFYSYFTHILISSVQYML